MRYKVIKKQNNSAMCFICGLSNSAGVHMKYYECEKPDGERVLLGVIKPREEHQSYPNRMHGGVASAILDESIGRAFWLERDDWGVTMELSVKFRKPTPLDRTLYIEGKLLKVTSRAFEAEGKLFYIDEDGKEVVCATGVGTYLILPIEKIAQEQLEPANWFYDDEKLPEYIDVTV
jgi:acyl-coenzyme A thioesterase PaaI-like protein